jgi:hypothetical protein
VGDGEWRTQLPVGRSLHPAAECENCRLQPHSFPHKVIAPSECRQSSASAEAPYAQRGGRAQEARIHAELIIDPESKRMMLEIAGEYERIAQRAEERMRDSERHPPASSIGRTFPLRRKRWF